jgi:UDP:flavonoid glycosyltransferase YjiC (YdhE family)
MARILIATTPAMGHISPLVPLAKALVGRGHDIVGTQRVSIELA